VAAKKRENAQKAEIRNLLNTNRDIDESVGSVQSSAIEAPKNFEL